MRMVGGVSHIRGSEEDRGYGKRKIHEKNKTRFWDGIRISRGWNESMAHRRGGPAEPQTAPTNDDHIRYFDAA